MNTKCPKGKTCTDCKYENLKRIQELKTYMKTHKHFYLDDYCVCEDIAQELSDLGYAFPETNNEGGSTEPF
jgi:hypothetical protein